MNHDAIIVEYGENFFIPNCLENQEGRKINHKKSKKEKKGKCLEVCNLNFHDIYSFCVKLSSRIFQGVFFMVQH